MGSKKIILKQSLIRYLSLCPHLKEKGKTAFYNIKIFYAKNAE